APARASPRRAPAQWRDRPAVAPPASPAVPQSRSCPTARRPAPAHDPCPPPRLPRLHASVAPPIRRRPSRATPPAPQAVQRPPNRLLCLLSSSTLSHYGPPRTRAPASRQPENRESSKRG